MAGDESVTPEKQLLKLIEDPKRETLKAAQVKRSGRKWFSLGAFRGRFAFWKSTSTRKWTSFQNLAGTSSGIASANLILKVLVLFLSLYLGYSVVAMGIQLKKATNLILGPRKNLGSEISQPPLLQNISYYAEKAATRDLFKLESVPVVLPKGVSPKEAAANEIAKNYSLVGISWSDNPEAMIEDTVSKRTNFVKKGQMIEDRVQVVAIFKDRVVLSYQGTEFELK